MGNFGRGDRHGGRDRFRGGDRFRSRDFDRGGRREDRQMYDAVCDNCGKACKVPFKPTSGKPVYCDDCFGKMGKGGQRQSSGRPNFEPKKQDLGPIITQFDALNQKLDKILHLLEVEAKTPEVKETIVMQAEPEVKVGKAEKPKAEKTTKTVKADRKKTPKK